MEGDRIKIELGKPRIDTGSTLELSVYLVSMTQEDSDEKLVDKILFSKFEVDPNMTIGEFKLKLIQEYNTKKDDI